MTEPRRPGEHPARRRGEHPRPPGEDRRGRRPDPRGAGLTLVAAVLVCAGAGLGIGALAELPVPFALAGFFGGLAVGFALVYSRFKDI